MGISDDIKPKRGRHTTHHRHTEHIFDDDFDYLDEKPHPEPIKSLHDNYSRDIKAREKLENDFFSHNDKHRETEEKEEDEDDEHETNQQKPKHKKSKFGTVLIWLMVIALLGLLGWQNRLEIKNLILEKIFNQKITTSPIEATKTDDYYSGESSSSTSTSATPETTPVPAPADIDKTSVKIEILNGNGIKNSGAAAQATLESSGFTIAKTANAKNFNYATTLIYYKTGKDAEANLIKTALVDKETTIENNDTLAGAYDVVIVLGAK